MTTAIKSKTISKGFLVAGLFNMTVLVFSRFFTNAAIPETDPVVMSNFGLVMIVVWGLAYISVAKTYYSVKWLVGVFALEKLIYGFIWIDWMLNNSVMDVFSKDKMAGIFYAVYGVNDWLFFIFFLLVFVRLIKFRNNS
jgi:hypothetical protein